MIFSICIAVLLCGSITLHSPILRTLDWGLRVNTQPSSVDTQGSSIARNWTMLVDRLIQWEQCSTNDEGRSPCTYSRGMYSHVSGAWSRGVDCCLCVARMTSLLSTMAK